MGAVSSACGGCFGNTETSAKSLFNTKDMHKITKSRISTEEDLDKTDCNLFKRETCASLNDYEGQEDIKRKKSVSLEDFSIIKLLGKGSFGKVYLVQKKGSQKYYALKVFKKRNIVSKQLMECVMNEKNILKGVKHPFVVSLKYAFQSKTKAYIVMDLCDQGDIFKKLKKAGKFDENTVRLCAAELVLAFQYLHEDLNTIHRDIKAENILIGSDGHIKLIFEASTRAMSLCGTLHYLAPEIIVGRYYGPTVDWWSLGCLMYEMLTGSTPFAKKGRLVEAILTEEPEMPADFSSPLQDLLRKLLMKEARKRLGFHGAEEIKAHPFFKDIDWEALTKKKLSPPFKLEPPQGHQKDSNRESLLEALLQDPKSQSTDHIYLKEFSYVANDGLLDVVDCEAKKK